MVVLDEPSLGLAPKVVGEIIAALAALRDSKRLAVLLIEQNIRAAFTVADRVLVMERGSVVAQGTPAERPRTTACVPPTSAAGRRRQARWRR